MQTSWSIRLQRDLKELAREPLEGIEIHVDEKDVRSMCLILSPSAGPFSGWRLHFTVKIPLEYPTAPPAVTIQTSVPHPNVFGDYICCDILRGDDGGAYTPGYLLKYIFLQLLSFFSSRNIEQDYGGKVNLEKHASSWFQDAVSSFQCSACGFNKTFSARVESPSTTTYTKQVSGAQVVADKGSDANPFQRLNDDCCMNILDRLSDQDAIRLTQAFEAVREVADFHNCLLRRQLVCFYLRKTFLESVLGIGLQVQDCKPVVTMLDLVSYEAHSLYGVYKGVTGARFFHFLPVALNDDHFRRAESLIKQRLVGLMPAINMQSVWSPNTVLRTIPPMMNKMVLELVQSCDNMRRGWRSSDVARASEKALQGYCLLFHLLSKLVRSDPMLGSEIQEKVNRFIRSRDGRHKSSVPDLGEFLTYFLVAEKVDWTQACGLFMEELLARNVVWYLEKLHHLAYLEPDKYVSERRLDETFNASGTSLRLVMFQVNFFNITRSRLAEFDQRYGYPSSEMSANLLKSIKDIYLVKDWDVFMKLVGYQVPEREWKFHVARMLKEAVKLSESNGYHCNPYNVNELYVLRRDVEIRCPPPPSWPGCREEQYESRYNRKYNVNTGKSFFPKNNRQSKRIRSNSSHSRRWY